MASAYRREGVALRQFNAWRREVGTAAFTAAWNASTTVAEVAERTGKSPVRVHAQATRLRKRGISLKDFSYLAAARVRERAEEFAALWNASRSPAEVAAALGVGRQAVENRASRLRKRGFALKAFRPGTPPASQRQADARNP
jgi:biotin operon repressor